MKYVQAGSGSGALVRVREHSLAISWMTPAGLLRCYTVCMYSNIKQLRRYGVRLERESDIGPGVFGVVELVHSNCFIRLTATEWGNNSPSNRLLADLWDVKCHNLQGNTMRWIGYQREHQNAPTYFQEWLITFISEYPPKEVIHSQRRLNTGTL